MSSEDIHGEGIGITISGIFGEQESHLTDYFGNFITRACAAGRGSMLLNLTWVSGAREPVVSMTTSPSEYMRDTGRRSWAISPKLAISMNLQRKKFHQPESATEYYISLKLQRNK
jgi:hypothetical protein